MKYILVVLRLIEWVDKKTGEASSCYAYTSSNASTATVFGSKVAGSLNIRKQGVRVNAPADDVTLWLNDLTEEEYQLYVDAGNDQAYLAVEGDIQNPTSSKVITKAEFASVDSPQMLFQQA